MHQEPNSMSLHPEIPATQPVEGPASFKRAPEPQTPKQSTKEPKSPKQSIKALPNQLETQSTRPSSLSKCTTSDLNDSACIPLSMRALYYVPSAPSLSTDQIPTGSLTEAISPSTSTTAMRKHDTYLVLDTSFPTPQPSPSQYLLKVHRAAFCHDEIRLATALNPPITTPRIPLHSICGTVLSTPREHDSRPDGPRFSIGDTVFGLVSYTRDGGAAEYAVATEFEMAPKPDNVTVSEAAAIALPALTAWQALFRYAGLDPDVPGGLYDVPEFGPGGNGTGRWQWQRKRRDTVLGSGDYGYGHRKSVNLNGSRNRNSSGRSSGRSPGDAGGLEQGMNDDASGSTGSGTWVWHWNRRDTILNDMSSGAGSGIENIDNLPGASAASTVDPDPNPYPTAALNATKTNSNVRRESLISLVSGTPKAAGKAPRAASTIDPNPKNTVRRASLVNLVRGNKTEPSSASSTASGNSRRGSLLDLVSGEGSRLGRLGSLIGTTNESANDKNPAKIRVLITNARDSEIGRIAVQLLRAETLFPAPVRPWLCVTCTPAEVEIIENDWNVDEIIVIPHLPSASECNISKVFRARRWDPVDIVLDCAGEEVFRQAHAAGVVKDYGAVLTVVDSKVAMQSPLVPENDELGERKRGIRSRFVPVNPDGPAIERIAELIEENLVRGKEARVVDLARSADLLAAGAAGTAGGLRGDMVVVKVQ